MSVLFKRLRHKDNVKDEHKVDNDVDNVQVLLSSLDLCNEDDNNYLISNVIEDLHVPLPASLKLNHCSCLTIAGHCDGIICLKLFFGNVILCNPAMKEFKLIPKSFLLLPNDEVDLEFLPYDLKYYSEYLGFGYDPKGKGYKIVRFVIYDESCYWFRAEVYNMNSDSWREIRTEYNAATCFANWSADLPIYLNGLCYWHATGYHNEWKDFILSFDMSHEVFHETLIPDLPDACRVHTLALWKEFVALLTYQEEIGVPKSYDMWVMTGDHGDGKGSWTKHVSITHVGVEGNICPLLFLTSDQLLMVATNGGHIILYNNSTQIFKYLPIHFMEDMIYSQAVGYVNSIVSIGGGNTLEDVYISAFYGRGTFYSRYGDQVI